MNRMFYRDRSPIHGWGCFCNGNVFTTMTVKCPCFRNDSDPDDRSIWVDDEVYQLYNPFCFINHSDEPNAELYEQDGSIYLHLTRRIAAKEEITIDYGPDWDQPLT